MREYDVAVVGAGLAGCAAATLLGRAGASVALLESHEDPRAFKRICTHAIQPSAGPTLERLGIAEAIAGSGAQAGAMNLWTRFGWISFGHERASPPMCRYPIWNIRRETLDPMLRTLAAETDGVELMLGHTVREVLHAPKPRPPSRFRLRAKAPPPRVAGVVAGTRDGGERRLAARLVVAADGRDSHVARLLDQPAKRKPHNRFCYYAYYRDTPTAGGSSAQLWLLDPDVAYSFPTDGGLTLLACMIHRDRLEEFRRDPEPAMQSVFAGLPDAPLLDPSRRVGKVLGKLDMPNVTRTPWRPGMALVGDAALAADPLWGVGCGWALQSAEWLADAVAPALGGGADAIDRALRRYARRHARALSEHQRFSSAYATGRRFTVAHKLLYRAAVRDEELAGGIALLGGRWIKPHELLTPRLLGRVVRANLSPRPTSRPLST